MEIRELRNMAEVSNALAEADEIFRQQGHTPGIDFLNSVRLKIDGETPSDPLSPEYRDFMLDLYKVVSNKDGYNPEAFEKANLSLRDTFTHQWPYNSYDPAVVGSYFMGVAHLTRVLGLYGCKRVFEYGTGWGHTALMMARTGMDVTACDIDPVFLDRLTAITAFENTKLKTFQGQFGEMPDDETYDAFVFFECFHHCFDFIEVVPKLKSRLNPGGKILLGGEPMLKHDDPPWSLRTDGHALWAIRTHGWMELGFREDFLLSFFDQHGFEVTGHPCPSAGDSGFIYTFHLKGD